MDKLYSVADPAYAGLTMTHFYSTREKAVQVQQTLEAKTGREFKITELHKGSPSPTVYYKAVRWINLPDNNPRHGTFIDLVVDYFGGDIPESSSAKISLFLGVHEYLVTGYGETKKEAAREVNRLIEEIKSNHT